MISRKTMTERLVNLQVGFFETDAFIHVLRAGFRGFDEMDDDELRREYEVAGLGHDTNSQLLDTEPDLGEFTQRGMPWPEST